MKDLPRFSRDCGKRILSNASKLWISKALWIISRVPCWSRPGEKSRLHSEKSNHIPHFAIFDNHKIKSLTSPVDFKSLKMKMLLELGLRSI
jgi:hypothetical protein